jgi:hypothetical protein
MGLIGNILDESNEDLLYYFKVCTKIKFRYNYSDCEPEVYEFNMSGSAAALNFMR